MPSLWLVCCWDAMMPNQLKLEESWEEVKEKLKEINTGLTDEDLVCHPGGEEELVKKLSLKMKKSEEAIRIWIESVSSNRGKAS